MVKTDEQERKRLEALARYDVLDTPREEAFDRITRLTQRVFGVPMATVAMIDGHRQWFKSRQGVAHCESARNDAFCDLTIQGTLPLIVNDASNDPRFADNPLVVGAPNIRFYAGVPLTTKDGHNIGTLCAIDTRPRDLDAAQVETLIDFARLVMDELELRMLAATDGLTGAMSRRAFREDGERSLSLALRHAQDMACIVFDLDHFKALNDTYGHAAGDTVLEATVKTCFEELRRSDSVGRLGGEEFGVLLPQTGRRQAADVAEKLRASIEARRFLLGGLPTGVTASFGIAAVDRRVTDIDTLLENADAAVYEAKAAGRNRCVVWKGSLDDQLANRRRVLKAGRIHFNDRKSSLDCTVRSLSEDGAGLDMVTTAAVPKEFELLIKADKFEAPCRVVLRNEKHLEVEFLASSARPSPRSGAPERQESRVVS